MPPPPRKVFDSSDRVGVGATYNLGGDGDGFEIGGMDANKRNGSSVFVNIKDKAIGDKGAKCCFRSSLNKRQSACDLRFEKGDRGREMFRACDCWGFALDG